ncbi:MAG: preprotein translocase subunit SecG [Oscillospiraceae bacterium]|jgi:preprotein translocase subunit SecG|nr:preprotein translocase subunit SecG [Oscillospiraceae bacterium]
MNIWEIIAGVLLLICCLGLILLVMMQESKQGGLGSTFGDSSSESYFGKNSGRTLEAMLAKITKYCAIVFFVLTILVSVFSAYIN